jgi:hypothetical protein
LVKAISTIANLNNKKENMVLKLVSVKQSEATSKDKDTKVAFSKDTIKLMVY